MPTLTCDKCGNIWDYRGSKTTGYVTCSSCKHPVRIGSSPSYKETSYPGIVNTGYHAQIPSTNDSNWVRPTVNFEVTPEARALAEEMADRNVWHYQDDVVITLTIRVTREALEYLQRSKDPYATSTFSHLRKDLIDLVRKHKPGTGSDAQTILKMKKKSVNQQF